MTYDFKRKRWFRKPNGTRWANYVLGPRMNSIRLIEHKELVVSAYEYEGKLRYSRPVTDPESVAGPNVLYRIRVRLKDRSIVT